MQLHREGHGRYDQEPFARAAKKKRLMKNSGHQGGAAVSLRRLEECILFGEQVHVASELHHLAEDKERHSS